MRSLRVREKDRLPEDYPIISDWVAPLGAQAKLNPQSRVAGMSLSTSNETKDKDFQAMMRAIGGQLVFETTKTRHTKTRGVFDGYDKKKKVIERETELAGPDAIFQNEMFAEGVDAVPASPASFPSGRSRGMTYKIHPARRSSILGHYRKQSSILYRNSGRLLSYITASGHFLLHKKPQIQYLFNAIILS